MAPKGKCPTPPAHESSQTDASSGEESRTGFVPPRAEEQRKEVENAGPEENESGDSESEYQSSDEGAKQEPPKPLQSKKPSSDSDSDSDSDSRSESNPEDGTRPVESVAATKERTPTKKPARYQSLSKQPAKRGRNAVGEEESTNHEPLKPSQPKKPSPELDTSSESWPEDETGAVVAAQQLKNRPVKKLRKGSDANDEVGAKAAAQHIGERSVRFQRLWTEKDEIELLQGMIEFREKERLEPSANVRVFRHFLNKSSVRFDFPANESQFRNKIRKMKDKFVKASKSGRIWKNPHDQKVSELSRILWGGDNGGKDVHLSLNKSKTLESAGNLDGAGGDNGGKDVHLSLNKSKTLESAGNLAAAPSKMLEEFQNRDWASVPSLLQLTSMGLDEEVLKIGMGMIDPAEMKELKERWRQLRLSELQVASDRATLMNHQAKLFMDGYRRAK